MARLAVTRLNSESLQKFALEIERHQALGPNPYLYDWLNIVADGLAATRTLFLNATEHGRLMRSCAPLYVFVRPEERRLAFEPTWMAGDLCRLFWLKISPRRP